MYGILAGLRAPRARLLRSPVSWAAPPPRATVRLHVHADKTLSSEALGYDPEIAKFLQGAHAVRALEPEF